MVWKSMWRSLHNNQTFDKQSPVKNTNKFNNRIKIKNAKLGTEFSWTGDESKLLMQSPLDLKEKVRV